jgi:lipopolysaccharide transport system ATP-binding protein
VSDSPVVFDNVWKKFRRGERHDSLRDLIPSVAQRLLGRAPKPQELETEEFWAVRDVSFEVGRGHALGIIGPNGAGKSTTLKLLTRILRPTKGSASVSGRIGALIEVAAGFHPDLTGRENVFMQGAIMGMKKLDIARRFDEIVAFAGVSEFIDTPVKRYSSGMNARLGFAIAAHLDPDVLIIDEVLSVGDMAFQQRCTDRMLEFRDNGVTIVFVSHHLHQISRLCDLCLFIQRDVKAIGATADVIGQYVRVAESQTNQASGGAIEITGTNLLDRNGQPCTTAEPGDALVMRVNYQVREPVSHVEFGLVVIHTTQQIEMYHANFSPKELGIHELRAGDRHTVDFRLKANLARGQYHFACHVFHSPTHEYLARVSPAALLSVTENRTRAGVVHLGVETELRVDQPVAEAKTAL